jgi:hypothetical protein
MSLEGPPERGLAQAVSGPQAQLVLAMVGSVCGTLITGALDTSPGVRLIGAVLGAAVPTLISYAGPHSHVRAGVGVLVTAVALFVTYGGFTLFDFATDRPETFPLPSALPQPDEDGGATSTTEDGLGIEVTPDLLRCSAEGCEEPVTIKSTGEELLMISEIEFVDGEAAAEFDHDGACENERLSKDEECRLSVSFTPSGSGGTRRARLEIHQNLLGPPTYVPVEGEAEDGPEPPAGDLFASPDGVRCRHQRAGTAEGEDALQISLSLQFQGASPDELPGVVISAQSDAGPSDSARGGVGEGRVMALALQPEHYGRTHLVTVRIDPEDEVPETDEDNNQLTVSVQVPEQPASSQDLPCSAQGG